jgi:hypothetical protein
MSGTFPSPTFSSVTLQSALPVASGGTGAATAAAARTALSAAASGANSDITALNGLTTPLSVARGGTGAETASAGLTSLGAQPSVNSSNVASVVSGLVTAGGGAVVASVGQQAIASSPPTDFAGVAIDFLGPTVPVSLLGETAGSDAISQKATMFQDAGSHVGKGHIGHTLSMSPVGGGSNLTTYDAVLAVTNIKQNIGTDPAVGQLDGVDIYIRNGGATGSDSSAILANVSTVGQGFNCMFEGTTSVVSGDAVTMLMDVQGGVINTTPGSIEQFGFVAQMFTGTGTCGIQVQSNSGAGWTNYIQCVDGTDVVRFQVSGNGLVTAQGMSLLGPASIAATALQPSLTIDYENDFGISLQQSGTVSASSIGVVIDASSTTGAYCGFQFGGTLIGAITTSTGTSTTYGTTSDRRLKDIHGDADGAVIDKIRVYRASFKSEPDAVQDMVIADEVHAVVPHAVTGEPNALRPDGTILPQMVDNSKLVPSLVAYTQNMNRKLDTVVDKLTSLCARMDAFESRYAPT